MTYFLIQSVSQEGSRYLVSKRVRSIRGAIPTKLRTMRPEEACFFKHEVSQRATSTCLPGQRRPFLDAGGVGGGVGGGGKVHLSKGLRIQIHICQVH